eukprot:g5664.t1
MAQEAGSAELLHDGEGSIKQRVQSQFEASLKELFKDDSVPLGDGDISEKKSNQKRRRRRDRKLAPDRNLPLSNRTGSPSFVRGISVLDEYTPKYSRRKKQREEDTTPSQAQEEANILARNKKEEPLDTPEKGTNNSSGAQLSEDEKAKYQDAFATFDKDGSGSIDMDELESVMNSIGMHPSKQELQAMIDEVDDDGSGEVDMEEFLEMMAKDKAKSAGEKSSGMADVVKKLFINTLTAPRNAEEAAAQRQHRRLYLGLKRDNDTTFRDPNPTGGTFAEYLLWCEHQGFGKTQKTKVSTGGSATELIPWDVDWKRDSWWGEEQDLNAIKFSRAIHRVGKFLRKEDVVEDEIFQILREEAAVTNLADSIERSRGTLNAQLLHRAEWLLDKARVYIAEHKEKYEKKIHLYDGEMPKWWLQKVIKRRKITQEKRVSKLKSIQNALEKMKKLRDQDRVLHEDQLEDPCFKVVDNIVSLHGRSQNINKKLRSGLDPLFRPPSPPEERWTKYNPRKGEQVSYQPGIGYKDTDADNPYRSSGRAAKLFTVDDKHAMRIVGDYVTESAAWMTELSIKKRSPEERLAFAKRLVRMYIDALKPLNITREVTRAREEIMAFIEKILPAPGTVETKAEKKARIESLLYDGLSTGTREKGEQETPVETFARWSGITQEELYARKLASKKLPKAEQPWICLVCMNANVVGTSKCSVCFRKPGEPATSWKLAKHRPRNKKLSIKYFHTHNLGSYHQQNKWRRDETLGLGKEKQGVDWLNWESPDKKAAEETGDEDETPGTATLPELSAILKKKKTKEWKPFLTIDESNLPQISEFKYIGREKRDWLTGKMRPSRHTYHLLY